MRNVAIATVLLFLSTATVIGLSGCREESADMSLRRAKLVGNENIELKKQLKQRDKEIKRQKQLVVQCRTERDKAIERQKQLVGNEIIELKKQLKQRDEEIKRQKQLVGHEIVELKRQLKQRDKEIKRQKQLVVKYRAKRTNGKELNDDTLFKMLQHLAESGKQVKALTAENTQLKEKIKELEAK